MDQDLQALTIRLAESVVRNTAGAIVDRVNTIKTKKDLAQQVTELEQIINDLMSDKTELVRIAHAYENELVAQRISADDVQYITANLVPVIRQLVESASDSGQASQPSDMMALLQPILSVETVTILQLLGFNFRSAIGQPLTQLVGNAIQARTAPAGDSAAEKERLGLQREIAIYEVAKDPEAFARLQQMMGSR